MRAVDFYLVREAFAISDANVTETAGELVRILECKDFVIEMLKAHPSQGKHAAV
jgi:hypothetical protein